VVAAEQDRRAVPRAYLAIRSGAPRVPEARPEHDAIPITIDIPRAVHAVSSALDPLAVPPG
jgi:hypothetical protein